MACPELFSVGTKQHTVEFGKYAYLDNNRKCLIKSWWKKAKDSKQKEFEPFIFAWFAFNSWGMCITEANDDAEMIKSLALCNTISQTFDAAISKADSELAKTAKMLAKLLPIFDVKDLRQKGLERWDKQNRRERVLFYINNGATDFQPKCWNRHITDENAGIELPLDWSHILKAIYKIRCNLFHGSKSPVVETDKKLVSLAYYVLVQFLDESNYLR